MNWHVDPPTADRYVRHALDRTDVASVEAHLLRCDTCRATVGTVTRDPLLDELWLEIEEVLDAPCTSWTQRALLRVGVSDATARIVTLTWRVRVAYLLAVVCFALLALVAANSPAEDALGIYLLVAPIGPLLATATAFGRRTDPAYELMLSVPTTSLRILLLRTVSALAPAILLTAVSSLWLLDRGWYAVAWLLPALALALGALALSSWMPLELASGVLGGAWLVVPVVLRLDRTELLDALTGPVQAVSLALTAIAVIVVIRRRTSFDYMEA